MLILYKLGTSWRVDRRWILILSQRADGSVERGGFGLTGRGRGSLAARMRAGGASVLHGSLSIAVDGMRHPSANADIRPWMPILQRPAHGGRRLAVYPAREAV